MGKGCDDSICIDKPINSIIHPNNAQMGLYKTTEGEKLFPQRPLYRTEFGSITWKMFHKIGLIYPESPSDEDKKIMEKMITGLSEHFPCKECSEHFQKEISIMPTKLENRVELSKWICYQHNQVNKRLGKELYDCNNNINKLISDYKLV